MQCVTNRMEQKISVSLCYTKKLKRIRIMKRRILLILLTVCVTVTAYAQPTGTRTIGGSLSGGIVKIGDTNYNIFRDNYNYNYFYAGDWLEYLIGTNILGEGAIIEECNAYSPVCPENVVFNGNEYPVKVIGRNAIKGDVEYYTIPSTVSILELHAFYYASKLRRLDIADSSLPLTCHGSGSDMFVTPYGAFSYDSKLSTAYIGRVLYFPKDTHFKHQSWNYAPFEGRNGETTIYILGPYVDEIYDYTFARSNMAHMVVRNTKVPKVSANSFYDNGKHSLYVMPGMKEKFERDEIWSKNFHIYESCSMHQPCGARNNKGGVTSVYADFTIDSGGLFGYDTYTMTVRGEGATEDYTNNKEKEFLIHSLSPWSDMENLLKKAVVEEGVILGSSFFYNTGIEELTIPNTFIMNCEYGHSTFEDVKNLKLVNINMVNWAFGLYPTTVPYIPAKKFRYFYKGEPIEGDYYLPDDVDKIGPYALANNKDITAIHLTNNVKEIDKSAFMGCSNLKAATINITNWEKPNVLYDVLGKVPYTYEVDSEDVKNICLVPDGTKTIGDHLLYGCKSLHALVIPASVHTIGDYAFANCTNLTNVAVSWEGSNIPVCNEKAFEGHAQGILLHVPNGAIGDYKAKGWDKVFQLTETGNYLYFSIDGAGLLGSATLSVCKSDQWKHIVEPKLEYAVNEGVWQNVEYGKEISVSKGDKVYFRAGSNGIGGSNEKFSYSDTDYIYFKASNDVSVGGELISLISSSLNDVKAIPDGAFISLFDGCPYLTDASSLLLPKLPFSIACYQNMFAGCSSLKHIKVPFDAWPNESQFAVNPLQDWVNGVADDGIFECGKTLPVNDNTFDNNHIPGGWTARHSGSGKLVAYLVDVATKGAKIYDGTDIVPDSLFSYEIRCVAKQEIPGLKLRFNAKCTDKEGKPATHVGNDFNVSITASLDDANYELQETRFTATADIEPKPITVKADPKIKEYGKADPELTWTATGLVQGDRLKGITAEREWGEEVGKYEIYLTDSEYANTDYALTLLSDSLTIRPAVVSMVPMAFWSYYGDPIDPDFLALSEMDLPQGVTWDPSVSISCNPGKDAGEYPLTITISGENAPDEIEYVIPVDAYYVLPRPIVITADSISKQVGADDPELTYTIANLIEGDEIKGIVLHREPGEAEGTYVISFDPIDEDLNPNYSIELKGAVLTISNTLGIRDIAAPSVEKPRKLLLNDKVIIRINGTDFDILGRKQR